MLEPARPAPHQRSLAGQAGTPHTDDRGSRANALAAARAALEKQAEHVVILDLRKASTISDFFLVCTADNSRHVEALKDHLAEVLLRRGCRVEHTEGAASMSPAGGTQGQALHWVLMDCGDLVIHLFDRPARDFYRLEDLWADAPEISLREISDE